MRSKRGIQGYLCGVHGGYRDSYAQYTGDTGIVKRSTRVQLCGVHGGYKDSYAEYNRGSRNVTGTNLSMVFLTFSNDTLTRIPSEPTVRYQYFLIGQLQLFRSGNYGDQNCQCKKFIIGRATLQNICMFCKYVILLQKQFVFVNTDDIKHILSLRAIKCDNIPAQHHNRPYTFRSKILLNFSYHSHYYLLLKKRICFIHSFVTLIHI